MRERLCSQWLCPTIGRQGGRDSIRPLLISCVHFRPTRRTMRPMLLLRQWRRRFSRATPNHTPNSEGVSRDGINAKGRASNPPNFVLVYYTCYTDCRPCKRVKKDLQLQKIGVTLQCFFFVSVSYPSPRVVLRWRVSLLEALPSAGGREPNG